MSYNYLAVSKRRTRRRKTRRPITGLLLILMLLMLGWLALWYTLMPTGEENTASVSITVPPNATTAQIAAVLEEKGVVRSARAFSLYARLHGLDGAMKPGVYKLSTAMPLSDVTEMLTKGLPDKVKVTIPEGYTVAQIANLLARQGVTRREDFFTGS